MRKPLLLTLEYPPQKGGVAQYLAGEVASSGEQVRVVKAQDFFWDKWPAWLPLLWRMRPAPDTVFWVSHVLPIGYVALAWKWRFKTPYRVYVHGLDLVRPSHSAWKRFWARMILKHADEIVANSRATAQLLNYYKINPGRARVQYPRINPPLPEGGLGGWEDWREYYAEQGRELRQRYALGGRPILLTISRLVKRKGIDLVIRALPGVWERAPDLTYVVVGDGEERENLHVIARRVLAPKQSRGRRVILTGAISEEEKYAWLSACDAFILTPIDDPNDFEGYGIVYKEAQMFGKPVIGSAVGGVPEAIGENGTLVDPGNLEQITRAILNNFPSLARRG